jgi:hypothetical protein
MLLLEKISTYFQRARTGHIDHHLSTTFEQVMRFAFKMLSQEIQRALGIAVHQDTHQLDDILIFEHNG